MTITPSLCNLPNELAINIFNRVGFKSIQNLRKVCRDLRNRIDDIKPAANLSAVEIYVNDMGIRFIYKSEIQNLDVEQSEDAVEYKKTVESGRSIVRSDGSETIVNCNFMELASRDFLLICRIQRKCTRVVQFINRIEYSNNFLQFLETLKSFLALENRLLMVDEFHIYTNDKESMITALSLIDPQSIYSIILYNNCYGRDQSMDIAEIMEMEHWKTAKSFKSDFIIIGIYAHDFRHFSDVDVKFQSISAEYLLDLKKIFENSTEAYLFRIRYKTFEGREQFLEKMGPSVMLGRLMWYFRMPTTDFYVLRIMKLYDEIVFERCFRCNVPEYAAIQN